MEIQRYICPICHKVMGFLPQSGLHMCGDCGLTLNLVRGEATVGINAPKWITDSLTAIDCIRDAFPVYVLADAQLFTEGFDIDKCWMVGPQVNIQTPMHVKTSREFSTRAKLEGKHLISCGWSLSCMFRSSLLAQLISKAETFVPVNLKDIPNNGELLMRWCAESTVEELNWTEAHSEAANLFMTPLLEEVDRWATGFELSSVKVRLTDEQMCLSHALAGANVYIPFTTNKFTLKDAARASMKTFLDSIDEEKFKEDVAKCVKAVNVGCKHNKLAKEYISGVRYSDFQSIMNGGSMFSPVEGGVPEKILRSCVDYTEREHAVTFYSSMFEKNLYEYIFENLIQDYGIGAKRCEVNKECSNNAELALEYWKMRKEAIKDD